jgi:hypothetical protein
MCDVTAAVVAGTAVAGAAASTMNKPKAQTTKQENAPWAVQQPYLEQGMSEAQRLYDETKDKPAYSGELSAGLNDTQNAGYQSGVNYANGTGKALAGQAADNAGSLMGATSPYLQNAAALAAGGAGALNPTTQGVLSATANGQPLAQTTVAGAAGLEGQQGALATAQGLSAQAAQDPNGGILAAARGYVDNDLINGQVDAATRDVARTLGEETLPGLNARAMAGGNVNSARAGAAEAVARRAAEDRAADISSEIRSNAYNTGLQTALTAKGQQDSLALGALSQAASTAGALSTLGESQRQSDGANRLSAATSLGSLSLQGQQLDASTRLQANGQLGQAALAGFDAAQSAGALQDANATRQVVAGDAQQADENRALQDAQTAYYAQQNYDQQKLQNYWGIVGQNLGSTTTTTTPAAQGPSMIQGALGGAALGAGLMSGGSGGAGALSGLAGNYSSVGQRALSGANQVVNAAPGGYGVTGFLPGQTYGDILAYTGR